MKQSISEKKVLLKQKPSWTKNVNIWVNAERGFYNCRGLDSYNRKYLISKGYKLKKFKNIQGKTERYLLKPIGNESLQHCFLINEIYYYLKKLTNQVWMFHSAKPDIVFEAEGDIYAIEVETGKSYRNAIKKLREKVKMLKQNYENNWFFVGLIIVSILSLLSSILIGVISLNNQEQSFKKVCYWLFILGLALFTFFFLYIIIAGGLLMILRGMIEATKTYLNNQTLTT